MDNLTPFQGIKKYLTLIGEYHKFCDVLSQNVPMEEKFGEFFQRDDIVRTLNRSPGTKIIDRKDGEFSEKFRKEGNRLYLKEKYDKSIEAYNYAVLFAPWPDDKCLKNSRTSVDPTLSFAFSNRSAMAYQMRKYEEAIKDIDRAFETGYPKEKHFKLEERKGKSYLALRKIDKALEIFSKLLSQAKSESNEENIKKMYKLIKSCDYKYRNTEEVSYVIYEIAKRGPEYPEFMRFKENVDLSNLNMVSDLIEVKYSETKGRHLIAARDIEPGEVLLVEKAFASTTPLGPKIRRYCNVCMRRAIFILPCRQCSLAVFCSEECQSSPQNLHHLECSVLPILIMNQVDEEVALVFRTLLKFTISDIISELGELKKQPQNSPLITSEYDRLIKFERSYLSLLSLEGNIDKRSGECFVETATNALLLVSLLQTIPNFWIRKDKSKIPLNKTLSIRLGGEIMKLLLNFQCNIHCVREVAVDPSINILSATCHETGYAIYTAFSLMNHSCSPNVLHSSWGDVKYLYAINDINEGDEILDTYGERYVSHDLKTRKANLKHTYFFDCDCEACTNKWPLFLSLPKESQLKCIQCNATLEEGSYQCMPCSNGPNLRWNIMYDAKTSEEKISQSLVDHKKSMNNLKFKRNQVSFKDVKNISKYISMLSRYTSTPSRPFVEAQEALLRTFDLMGSYYLIPGPIYDDLGV